MRGVILSITYTVILFYVLASLFMIVSSIPVPPSPSYNVVKGGGAFALSFIKNTSSTSGCYIELKTNGDLNVLDEPRLVGC